MRKLLNALLGKCNTPDPEPRELLTPRERDQRLQLARQLLAQGDTSAAKPYLSTLFAAFPDDPNVISACGIHAYMCLDFVGAKSLLERALAHRADHPEALKFLAVTLHRLGQDAEALAIARQASQVAPNDSQVANTLGVLLMNNESYDEAAACLNRALELAPKDTTSLINLAVLESRGRVHRRMDSSSSKANQIRKQILRSLLARQSKSELTPADAKLLVALAGNSGNHFPSAVAAAEQLYAIESLDHDAANLISNVFARCGDLRRAIEMREYAAEGAPMQSDVRGSMGKLLIAAGNKRWFEGWETADQDFLTRHRGRVIDEIPYWKGEKLRGKRLLVYQDQGFGDALLGLRLLRCATERGIDIVFWVAPPMGQALSQIHGCWVELVVSDDKPDVASMNCGAATPLFSLVRLLKLTPDDISTPVLIRPDSARHDAWKRRLEHLPYLRIGMAATGNPWRQDDWFRSIPPDSLRPLTNLTGISWVNLSVDKRLERDQIISRFSMTDPTGDLIDFADTAALIANLDAVVSIDCSVAHLASALGKPTFVLAPAAIDWRWQIGDQINPWWPATQMYRAEKPGVWEKAISKLCTELGKFCQKDPEQESR